MKFVNFEIRRACESGLFPERMYQKMARHNDEGHSATQHADILRSRQNSLFIKHDVTDKSTIILFLQVSDVL